MTRPCSPETRPHRRRQRHRRALAAVERAAGAAETASGSGCSGTGRERAPRLPPAPTSEDGVTAALPPDRALAPGRALPDAAVLYPAADAMRPLPLCPGSAAATWRPYQPFEKRSENGRHSPLLSRHLLPKTIHIFCNLV
ncbi:hypothetical protein MTO96_034060 [Rhipicephalus appendiculatus]